MPRLYREAPLCSIWEGSGNVMALDVLRALARTPEALNVFLEELTPPPAATRATTPTSRRCAASSPARRTGAPRAPGRRADGDRAAGVAAAAPRAGARSPTRSSPRAWRRRRPALRDAAAGDRRDRHHRAARAAARPRRVARMSAPSTSAPRRGPRHRGRAGHPSPTTSLPLARGLPRPTAASRRSAALLRLVFETFEDFRYTDELAGTTTRPSTP